MQDKKPFEIVLTLIPFLLIIMTAVKFFQSRLDDMPPPSAVPIAPAPAVPPPSAPIASAPSPNQPTATPPPPPDSELQRKSAAQLQEKMKDPVHARKLILDMEKCLSVITHQPSVPGKPAPSHSDPENEKRVIAYMQAKCISLARQAAEKFPELKADYFNRIEKNASPEALKFARDQAPLAF